MAKMRRPGVILTRPVTARIWEELAEMEEDLYDAVEDRRWIEVRRIAAALSSLVRRMEVSGSVTS